MPSKSMSSSYSSRAVGVGGYYSVYDRPEKDYSYRLTLINSLRYFAVYLKIIVLMVAQLTYSSGMYIQGGQK